MMTFLVTFSNNNKNGFMFVIGKNWDEIYSYIRKEYNNFLKINGIVSGFEGQISTQNKKPKILYVYCEDDELDNPSDNDTI